MKTIIVTLTNEKKSFKYDVELRCDRTVDKLKLDITEVVCGCNPDIYLDASRVSLYSPRLKRALADSESPETAGLWNGDYINITEVD